MEYVTHSDENPTNARLCVQLHIINIHQDVLVTIVTIIRVSYSKSTLIIQLIILKCMITPLHNTLNFQ